jgi:hypothetical protein
VTGVVARRIIETNAGESTKAQGTTLIALQRHSIVNFGHQFVGVRRDDREGAHPFAGGRVLPILPNSSDAERAPILHGNGIGLFGLLALDCFPLEEAIDGENAPPLTIGVTEGRQTVHGLAFGVDRLPPAFRVLAPVRNEAPAQRIE